MCVFVELKLRTDYCFYIHVQISVDLKIKCAMHALN